MPKIIADLPASACFSLHFESGIEQNQSLAPDLLRFAARHQAGDETRDDDTRDRAGRFAKGHSGNPRGRPRGIPNPKRRRVTLRAWRENPEACKALFKRQPWLLRRLLREFLPPVSAQDPAERIGLRLSSIRTRAQVQRAIRRVWSALSHGEIGTAEAARIARRIDARLRAAQRRGRLGSSAGGPITSRGSMSRDITKA
jgi:hypothetical protein